MSISKGSGTVSHFTIQMHESSALGVWVNVGPSILKDEIGGPSYVISVTLSPGNRYRAAVTSLSDAGESGQLNSDDIGIRK